MEEDFTSPPPLDYVVFRSILIKDNNDDDASDCASSISEMRDDFPFSAFSAKMPGNKDPVVNITASTSKTNLNDTAGTRTNDIDYASSNNRSKLQLSMEGGIRSSDLHSASIQQHFCSRSLGVIEKTSQPSNKFRIQRHLSLPTIPNQTNENDEEEQKSLPPDPPLRSILVPQSQQNRCRQVQFSTIEIRAYERILGDNPSCSTGPSVSIGWNYDKDKTTMHLIDEYEYRRTRRRDMSEMTLSREERFQLLVSLGYSRKEISTAVRLNMKLKKKRRQTVHNLPIFPVEEIIEGVTKKFSVIMKNRVSSKHLYNEWKEASTADCVSDGLHEVSLSSSSAKSSMKSSIKKSTRNLSSTSELALASEVDSQAVSNLTSLHQPGDEINAFESGT